MFINFCNLHFSGRYQSSTIAFSSSCININFLSTVTYCTLYINLSSDEIELFVKSYLS